MTAVVLKRSLGVIALSLVFGVPAHGQTLKAAVERTMESNPDILIDASRRLSLDQAVKGARGGYLPRADLALGGGREWSDNATTRALGLPGDRALNRTEASLTLTQMLFDGFAVKSEVERNQARVDSAANRLAGTSEQVALQAVEAYLEVLRHRDLVQLTRWKIPASTSALLTRSRYAAIAASVAKPIWTRSMPALAWPWLTWRQQRPT